MFVFDVSDTQPEHGAPPLPPEITAPFEVQDGEIGNQFPATIENAKRDGVHVSEVPEGAQSAGSIQTTDSGSFLELIVKKHPRPEYRKVPIRYELLLNSRHSKEEKYATLTHELAHLYCGHLGTPYPDWWPDRRGLDKHSREFEAESVCYLVCERLGIRTPSHRYLSGYLKEHEEVPSISLDCVMRVAGLVERMGRERLKARKESK